jgi:hypothetical protein
LSSGGGKKNGRKKKKQNKNGVIFIQDADFQAKIAFG